MKINGVSKLKENTQTYTVVRDGLDPIIFTLKPADMKWFTEIVEEPSPPMVTKPGEPAVADLSDPKYVEAMESYSLKQGQYFIISSISATEGLEWEKIDLAKPDTWEKFEEELDEFKLLPTEKAGLLQAITRANSLDQKFIDAKRDDFLALKAAQANA